MSKASTAQNRKAIGDAFKATMTPARKSEIGKMEREIWTWELEARSHLARVAYLTKQAALFGVKLVAR